MIGGSAASETAPDSGPPADERLQTKKSIGRQPQTADGRSRAGRGTRTPRHRRALPVFALLDTSDPKRHFETGTMRYLLSNAPTTGSVATVSGCSARQTPHHLQGRCKCIRTLIRNPLVTAADIRHRNPHRNLQAIRRSFWRLSDRQLAFVYDFEAIKIESIVNCLLSKYNQSWFTTVRNIGRNN